MAENIIDKIPYEKIWVIPPWQRWLAVCGVIFLFFVIYYYVSHKNTVEEINRLVSDRDKLITKYRGYEKYVKKMPMLQKDIDDLNIKLKKAKIQKYE